MVHNGVRLGCYVPTYNNYTIYVYISVGKNIQ